MIVSFDGVLRQPRTIHVIQLWPDGPRLALPRTMPLISIPYFAGALLAMIVFDRVVPVVAILGAALSALAGGRADIAAGVLGYVIVPAAIVYLALSAEIDGRKPHNWLISLSRSLISPRRTWCGARAPSVDERTEYRADVSFWWDEGAPRLQHGWVRGGRISTAVPARFTFALRHRRRVLKAADGYEPVDSYEVPGVVEVRP